MAEGAMVKSELTEEMVHSGRELLQKLDRQRAIIKVALWLYLPESDQWRLVFGSPELRIAGPKRIYRQVQSLIARSDVKVPLSSVAVLDTSAPLIRTLSAVLRVPGISGIRFSRNTIDGNYIEDAYIYRVAA
jgi:hypothetical protein